MSVTIPFDSEFNQDIRIIQNAIQRSWTRSSQPSEIVELTQVANRMRAVAEEMWDDLPPDAKAVLATVAYQWINGGRAANRLQKVWKRLRMAIRTGYIVFVGRQSELVAYCTALNDLADVILTQIELDDPGYTETLNKAVDDAFSEMETTKAMTVGEARERIRHLSDQILDEL